MSDLLLMSGGLDSTALAALCKPDLCLTIDYGQRAARAELNSATKICHLLGLKHLAYQADISEFGFGDMAPNNKYTNQSEHPEFWPYRNQYLITIASMVAIKMGLKRILIGSVATDFRHKDGSLEFVEAMNHLLKIQEGELSVIAPALHMTTAELIESSKIPMDILGWSHSCHKADLSCGQCQGCYKHSGVLSQFGVLR
ncbi:7-cyano-7-deazaguanine synthase [Alkalimonas sp. NCh-2]|uniref:7-cyano-7-deazaguanine synthase n=1 Tax=Alkalimonas sp. NCh-2 TaxID=3144846 RepID=UPI0031F634EF